MKCAAMATIVLCFAIPALAAPAMPPLDAQARAAIERCRKVLRESQLPNGAIPRSLEGARKLIQPYYANVSAIALLTAHQLGPADEQDVQRVSRWIDWYTAHVSEDGTIRDFSGPADQLQPTADRDSIDTYAPSFLWLLRRYNEATGGAEKERLLPMARLALKGTESTIDPADGLAWSSIPHKVKYPMDNLDVWLGLAEGAIFFDAAGATEDAAAARRMADRIAAALPEFWQEDLGYFAWALSRKMHIRFEKPYPDGVINLFAAGRIERTPPALWNNLKRTFGDVPRLTPDFWLHAARLCGTPAEIEAWRTKVIAATKEEKINTERASRLLLALVGDRVVEMPLVRLELPGVTAPAGSSR